MINFDKHEKCTPCPNKMVGPNPCVNGEFCDICETFTDLQKALATPSYKIHKDKKSGVLVSLKNVT